MILIIEIGGQGIQVCVYIEETGRKDW